jgi:hypothetical protein
LADAVCFRSCPLLRGAVSPDSGAELRGAVSPDSGAGLRAGIRSAAPSIAGISSHRCTIPGLLHSPDDSFIACGAFHSHRIGEQTDCTGCHSLYAVYRFFHTGAARCAAHSGDIELFYVTH